MVSWGLMGMVLQTLRIPVQNQALQVPRVPLPAHKQTPLRISCLLRCTPRTSRVHLCLWRCHPEILRMCLAKWVNPDIPTCRDMLQRFPSVRVSVNGENRTGVPRAQVLQSSVGIPMVHRIGLPKLPKHQPWVAGDHWLLWATSILTPLSKQTSN